MNLNIWHALPPLERARSSTSVCVMNQRHVYVFPAPSNNTWATIETLDAGSILDIKNLYKTAKWQLINIVNSDFNTSFAYGSYQISQNEILIFGNSKGQSFIFNTTDIQSGGKDGKQKFSAIKTLKESQLCTESWFAFESDYLARQFGNFLYAVDCYRQNLHVFSLKDKQWNYSALKELGIN